MLKRGSGSDAGHASGPTSTRAFANCTAREQCTEASCRKQRAHSRSIPARPRTGRRARIVARLHDGAVQEEVVRHDRGAQDADGSVQQAGLRQDADPRQEAAHDLRPAGPRACNISGFGLGLGFQSGLGSEFYTARNVQDRSHSRSGAFAENESHRSCEHITQRFAACCSNLQVMVLHARHLYCIGSRKGFTHWAGVIHRQQTPCGSTAVGCTDADIDPASQPEMRCKLCTRLNS